jgi:hypothetical protein
VCQETAARDGLMKMKQVYESNPALGDPMTIQGQLTDNGHRLDKLRAELKKFQVKRHYFCLFNYLFNKKKGKSCSFFIEHEVLFF